MNRYLILSSGGHVFLIAAWLIFGTLLTKPRMSYYAVDLVSSMPAGGAVKEVVAPVPEQEVPKAPPAPVPVKERKLPPKEVIKVKAKQKKIEAHPRPQKKQSINLKAAMAVLDGQNPKARAGVPSHSDSNITAETGENFPYPWYLKIIANKLEEHWKPPSEFSPETVCVVAFTIGKQGEISRIAIEKSSGDSTYDELSRRAVLYSNPLPPLPAGYPEETLNVHMTFHGK